MGFKKKDKKILKYFGESFAESDTEVQWESSRQIIVAFEVYKKKTKMHQWIYVLLVVTNLIANHLTTFLIIKVRIRTSEHKFITSTKVLKNPSLNQTNLGNVIT